MKVSLCFFPLLFISLFAVPQFFKKPLQWVGLSKHKQLSSEYVVYEIGRSDWDNSFILNYLYKQKKSRIWGGRPPLVAQQLRKLFRTKTSAKIVSKFINTTYSKKLIPRFIKKYNINMEQFIVPPGGFRTFNDFFIRRLNQDKIKINRNSNCIVSPANSYLTAIQSLPEKVKFSVKKRSYLSLIKLLCRKSLAEKYAKGSFLIFRLAPYHYHRYHFPCNCIPLKAYRVHGKYESVSPSVYASGSIPLQENERQVAILRTDKFGDVACIIVGAMLVGKIFNTYVPERRYKKGDEMGYFEYGASTVVLIFEEGKIKILEKFLSSQEVSVKMGERIAVTTS